MKAAKRFLAVFMAALICAGALAMLGQAAAEPGTCFYENANFVHLFETNDDCAIVGFHSWPQIIHYDGNAWYHDYIDFGKPVELYYKDFQRWHNPRSVRAHRAEHVQGVSRPGDG